MKYLLIAEKPSLMKDIKACYEKHKNEIIKDVGQIVFISLSGHVCRIDAPDEYDKWAGVSWKDIDYPMVPSKWQISPINDNRKIKTLEEVRSLSDKCDGIIIATDSDVEGYGVYYLVETYLGLKDKPALRFIEHSLTDKEIFGQLLAMTDYRSDPIHRMWENAYLIRSRADWLIGMNATRIMSVKTEKTMRIGRVKAPTLKLVYDNSLAIENFERKEYYVITADYGDFKATFVDEKKEPVRFDDKPKKGFPQEGDITSVTSRETSTHAPKLYDLTSLQAEAGSLYGYKPDRTLQIIQTLYEKYKVISYPRTQCQYVSSEKAMEFPVMLSNMSAFADLAKTAASVTDEDIARVKSDKKVVNNKEVEKEAHDALLPTQEKPDLSSMSAEEVNVCHMIYARLLQQFMPEARENKTTVLIRHGDGIFMASGKVVIEQGWRALSKKTEETFLPKLNEGQKISASCMSAEKRTTKAPRRLTQASLIGAMKNIASMIEDKELKRSLADSQGIGTPATRASIISDLITSGYMDDKKDGLYITDLGKTYMSSLDGLDIIRPEFAARMDEDIKRVQRGEMTYEDAYEIVITRLKEMCEKMENTEYHGEKINVRCPMCGEEITERRYSYCCEGCGLNISKEVCGKKISKKDLGILVKGERVGPYSLTNRDGKKFCASFMLEDGKLKFDFSSGIICPACAERYLTINNGGAFCDCGLQVFRNSYGAGLSDEQLIKLVKEKETDILDMYSKTKNKAYKAILYLNDDFEVKMRFPRQTKKKEDIEDGC